MNGVLVSTVSVFYLQNTQKSVVVLRKSADMSEIFVPLHSALYVMCNTCYVYSKLKSR